MAKNFISMYSKINENSKILCDALFIFMFAGDEIQYSIYINLKKNKFLFYIKNY